MQTEQVMFDTIEQQQAVLGTRDENVKIIEKALSVTIDFRDSKAIISGKENRAIALASQTLESLIRLYEGGEEIKSDTVFRILESASAGEIEGTFQAMEDVVVKCHRGQPVKCKTIGQQNYIKALREKTITLCIGPAGTGKTYLAVAQAVAELSRGEIERIVMSRPAIEAGEERLGFLPGDLAQKVDPYLRPLYDALNDILGAEKARKLQERGTIEIAPLAYMRGRTLNHARVIIDESQNASLPTLKMALTRLGEGSKMVLTGDVTQIDLPHAQDSGLERCAWILRNVDDIAIMRLNNRDVIRHKLVRDIVAAFEKAEKAAQEKKERRDAKRQRPAGK